MAVELAPELLEILACPNCHGTLAVDHDRNELVCTAPDCGLAYPVRGNIPVLLIDEARPPRRRSRPATAAGSPSSAARSGAAAGPADDTDSDTDADAGGRDDGAAAGGRDRSGQ